MKVEYVRPWFFKTAVCPFCEETDFDLVGLKIHYEQGRCDQFNTIREKYELYCDEQDRENSQTNQSEESE